MWISEANKYGATDCYVVVCGNKVTSSEEKRSFANNEQKDNPKRIVNETEAKKWAENRGFTYYEVSAKEGRFWDFSQGVKNFLGTNIENMFEDIIYKTVPKDKLK